MLDGLRTPKNRASLSCLSNAFVKTDFPPCSTACIEACGSCRMTVRQGDWHTKSACGKRYKRRSRDYAASAYRNISMPGFSNSFWQAVLLPTDWRVLCEKWGETACMRA